MSQNDVCEYATNRSATLGAARAIGPVSLNNWYLRLI
jgi:hypothetical protein